MSAMKARLLFALLLLLDALILGAMIDQISISYQEAYGLLHQSDYVFVLARAFVSAFGANDFALRLPFLFIHLCNLCLIFAIARLRLKKPSDALLCALVYALIPGINVTSILVSKSVIILFCALLLCYLHLKRYKLAFFALCALGSVLDFSFSVIFLALFFYALRFKLNKLLIFSLIGFSINMYCFRLPIGGIPSGYFLDTLALLALLYSPFLFVYYFYTLYRGLVKKEDTLMLYIASTSILFSLLLSLRQGVDLFSFLPLSAVGLPVMVGDFFHNVRLRLSPFRRAYQRRFYIILIPLIFEATLLFGNKFLFLLEPKRHFLENFYHAKELAILLKKRGVHALHTQPKLQARLAFYGIGRSPWPRLEKSKHGKIEIWYLGKKAKAFELRRP